MYSQIIYRREVNKEPFHKTDKQWMDELGFNLSEVKLARKYLIFEWFISFEFKRLDHHSMYDIIEDRLKLLIRDIYGIEYREVPQSDKSISGEWEKILGKDEKELGEDVKSFSGEWENAFDIKGTEITSETTTESVVEEEKKTPSSAHNKIDFINWMRDVEARGGHRLKIRNEKTGKQDIMNEEIKKSMYVFMKDISFDVFEWRVNMYAETVHIIEDKKLKKYIFYPIREYDFLQFLKNINKFYGEISLILSKIAIKEFKTKIVGMLKPSVSVQPVEEPKNKKVYTPEETKAVQEKFRNQFWKLKKETI